MKYSAAILFFCVTAFITPVFAQSVIEKFTPQFNEAFNQTNQNDEVLLWVFFTDKGNSLQKYFDNPQNIVSEKSLKRRSKVLNKENLVSEKDIPLNENYINTIEGLGFKVKHRSKWFNGVSGWASRSEIIELSHLSFVKQLDIVNRIRNNYSIEKNGSTSSSTTNQNILKPGEIHSLNYGQSYTQLNQIKVPQVHDMGYTGAGVTICMMDAGFDLLSHQVFDSLNIIAMWDFVNNDPNVQNGSDMGDGSHGTSTLSTIGGFRQGELIGPAYGADFILTKTENTDSETPIEEDNWIAALEWADSIGVDLTSTSLGYLDFDSPYQSYTWQNMDGNTARITIAADLAVGLGIVVVNSAGNNGSNSSHNTLNAPADGDSVISVGAVNSSGTRSSFSSVGPTVDGRIKPDVMAMGSNVYVASNFATNDYKFSSGTSFSCPLLAGACALLLQADPSLTPIELRNLLRSTSSRSNNPDNQYGWGIINLFDAVQTVLPVALKSFTAIYQDEKIILNWNTASETNNAGFEIERKSGTEDWVKIGYIEGSGTTTNSKDYNFIDNSFVVGKNIYRLKQIDYNGTFKYSSIVEVNVNPIEFVLSQNYPNPFNPKTIINFQLPNSSYVTLKIYNVLGQEVVTLLDKNLEAGNHDLEFSADRINSGVYFYTLEANGNNGNKFLSTKKMIVLK